MKNGKVLTRFGVSLDDGLLKKFDDLLVKKGFDNRSQAIKSLVNEMVAEEELSDSKADAIGTINIVYDHHKRDLGKKLNAVQHDYHHDIVADTHVHLDHDNCLEVIIVRGKAGKVREIADRIISIKGIKFGKLSLAVKGKDLE